MLRIHFHRSVLQYPIMTFYCGSGHRAHCVFDGVSDIPGILGLVTPQFLLKIKHGIATFCPNDLYSFIFVEEDFK